MKYEVLLKFKYMSTGDFQIVGRVVIPVEYLNEQFNRYEKYAKKNPIIYDYLILVNELDDDGNFVQVIR